MLTTQRLVHVIAACLDCDWCREVWSDDGGPVHHAEIANWVHQHVERKGHTVEFRRTEWRTHAPRS